MHFESITCFSRKRTSLSKLGSLFYISSFLLILLMLASSTATAQEKEITEKKLRAVADAQLRNSTLRFVDKKTGKEFASTNDAPADAQLQIESPCNDWRYWNGVLNIAMINAGEVLHDTAYVNFSVRNIAFDFDNYQYFEKKYSGESKWEYPFGQRIVMEDLDDIGAMGASLIEVYRREHQARYRDDIDRMAAFIAAKEYRFEDSTLVRPVPQKWTIWADDLYMSVAFLSRMGELTGDSRYFDDAAKQVVNFHKHLFDQSRGLMTALLVLGREPAGRGFLGEGQWMGDDGPGQFAGAATEEPSDARYAYCAPPKAYSRYRPLAGSSGIMAPIAR